MLVIQANNLRIPLHLLLCTVGTLRNCQASFALTRQGARVVSTQDFNGLHCILRQQVVKLEARKCSSIQELTSTVNDG